MVKQVTIALQLPKTGSRRYMVFNRYAIQIVDSFRLMFFGLVDNNGVLVGTYYCSIDIVNLKRCRDNLTKYAGNLAGDISSQKVPWQPSPDMGCEAVNFINACTTGGIAELNMISFPIHPNLMQVNKDTKPSEVIPDLLAVLRCETLLQKSFILELCAGD